MDHQFRLHESKVSFDGDLSTTSVAKHIAPPRILDLLSKFSYDLIFVIETLCIQHFPGALPTCTKFGTQISPVIDDGIIHLGEIKMETWDSRSMRLENMIESRPTSPLFCHDQN